MYEGCLAYGIMDEMFHRKAALNPEWIDEHFPGIDIFAVYIGEDGKTSVVMYGYYLLICQETGVITYPTEEQKKKIEELYKVLCKHGKEEDLVIQYTTVVTGSFDLEQDLDYFEP